MTRAPDQVRYLALISAANSEFSGNLPDGFDLPRYWLEALLRTSLVTAMLERGAPRIASSRYEVCLAALLLDIGRFMLAHVRPARMADYLARSGSLTTEDARYALQQEIFGSSLRAGGARLVHAVARYVQDSLGTADDAERQDALIAAVSETTGMTADAARRLVEHHHRQVADIETLVAQLLR